MRVLVTGTDGYIGSLLAPLLVERGHEVMGLDTGFYREGWLYNDNAQHVVIPPVISKDLRLVTAADLQGFEAVVHLAELSNDPLGESDPAVTRDINHRGSVRLASLAKQSGVRRFVYTSSCSVYGVSEESSVTEESDLNPQTTYAECKVMVERDVAELADDRFSPTFLRNATAYGASPRMRFDIVLNNLAGLAWTTKVVAMTSDGTPWRPLVHLLDICRAVCEVLEAPADDVHNQILNVGDREANFQIREIASIVADVFPDSRVTLGERGDDNRSYRVSFSKIHEILPGFRCRWTPREGAEQLRRVFEQVALSEERFTFRAFTRLKQLRYLIETSQIDEKLFWREAESCATLERAP